jgi:hypothetical protein
LNPHAQRALRPEHSVSANSTTSAFDINITELDFSARIILNGLKKILSQDPEFGQWGNLLEYPALA